MSGNHEDITQENLVVSKTYKEKVSMWTFTGRISIVGGKKEICFAKFSATKNILDNLKVYFETLPFLFGNASKDSKQVCKLTRPYAEEENWMCQP